MLIRPQFASNPVWYHDTTLFYETWPSLVIFWCSDNPTLKIVRLHRECFVTTLGLHQFGLTVMVLRVLPDNCGADPGEGLWTVLSSAPLCPVAQRLA